MKIELLEYTPNPEKLIATAAKLCYSDADISDLKAKQTPEQVEKFLNRLMSMGHSSPIEHCAFTFAVEGVSRALTHQLVRHRIASYSQQSQRYVKMGQFEYVTPKDIEENKTLNHLFDNTMLLLQDVYDSLADILKHNYIDAGMNEKVAEKKAIENARAVLPNACATKIIFTMNARTLMNFFKHRCCRRAQDEINELAWGMLNKVKDVAPTLFKYAGPSCLNGNCTEGKMTCGKPYGKEEANE